MIRIKWPVWIVGFYVLVCLSANGEKVMGAYSGTCALPNERPALAEADVIALGDGLYKAVIRVQNSQKTSFEIQGKEEGNKTLFTHEMWTASIKDQVFEGLHKHKGEFTLIRYEPKSPTVGMKPPKGATVLLPYEEGKPADLNAWRNKSWKLLPDGSVQVTKGGNKTVMEHQSGLFHIEFKTPFSPKARGQGRGNSGVYFSSRYEVQILDSFGLKPGMGDCGSIYSIAVTRKNMCYPPGVWQTYDVIYQAPKKRPDNTFEPALLTVFHNGVMIHEAQPASHPTTASPEKENGEKGPLFLQDHGNPVCYRNIWYLRLDDQ